MTTTLAALGLGALVGLGIAVPLGAIGVLLLQTGMVAGWRPAAAGGLGAALVDLLYAAAAVVAGTTASALLAGRERVVEVVAAGVLGVVAAHGLVGGLRRRSGAVAPVGSVPVTGRPLRTLLRFVALTAVNPLTVVYFTVVAAGLTDRLADGGARVAFVLGIGLASAVWQLTLAGVGAVVGARVRPGVRSALVVTGYAVVALLAVALALP